MPRVSKWSWIKQATDRSLASVIDREEEFTICPYIHIPPGVLALYKEHNQYILLSRRNNLEP